MCALERVNTKQIIAKLREMEKLTGQGMTARSVLIDSAKRKCAFSGVPHSGHTTTSRREDTMKRIRSIRRLTRFRGW